MQGWDWNNGKKVVADVAEIRQQYPDIQEFAVSLDGEKIAATVMSGEDEFTALVNGELWPAVFEKLWYLRYLPDGRLTGLVRIDDEWTLVVDKEPWEERFEFAWCPKISDNGETIALLYKRDMTFGIAMNGKAWEDHFLSIRDYTLSPDGKHAAATVQVEALKEADIFGFFEGVWSVAVDGKAWDEKFVNTWNPCFNSDGSSVAVQIQAATS